MSEQAVTPDEPIEPGAVDWAELRSACHRCAWQEVWAIVGTDHVGAPAPGEVYIFGVARRHSAVTAALRGWYLESLSRPPKPDHDKTWKDRFARIKQVAAWESKVAAQYVSAADRAAHRARRDALRFLELAGVGEEQASNALPAALQMASAAVMGLDKAAQIADSGVRALRSGAVLTGTLEITSPGTWFDESEPLIKEAWLNAARPSLLGVPGIISSPFIRSQAEPRAHLSKSERVVRAIFGHQHIISYTASE